MELSIWIKKEGIEKLNEAIKMAAEVTLNDEVLVKKRKTKSENEYYVDIICNDTEFYYYLGRYAEALGLE